MLAAIAYSSLAWRSRFGAPSLAAYFAVVGVGWLALLGAWAGRAKRRAPTATPVFAWAIVFRLAGLAAMPIYEDDYFRYLWDGWLFLHAGTPYGPAPITFFGDPSVPEAMRSVLSGINNPDVPTIYAPLCQWIFLTAAWLAPGSLLALKLCFFGADLALVGLLASITPRSRLALVAWCPLLVLESSFNAHVDVIGVSLLVASLVASRNGRPTPAAALVALAVGVKPLALPAIPFLLWRGGKRSIVVFVSTMLALYVPFLARGGVAEAGGLVAFGSRWEFNSSLFFGLRPIFGAPTAKLLLFGGFVIAYAAIFRRWVRAGAKDAWPLDSIYALLFVTAPVLNAWYLLWLFPFVVIDPKAWSVSALAMVSLAYVTGLTTGRPELALYDQPAWVRPLEYGSVALVAAANSARTGLRRRRKTALSGASDSWKSEST